MPDGKAPKVIVGPDPVGRYKGGEDDAVDGDNCWFIERDGEDVGQMDHQASSDRDSECGD